MGYMLQRENEQAIRRGEVGYGENWYGWSFRPSSDMYFTVYEFGDFTRLPNFLLCYKLLRINHFELELNWIATEVPPAPRDLNPENRWDSVNIVCKLAFFSVRFVLKWLKSPNYFVSNNCAWTWLAGSLISFVKFKSTSTGYMYKKYWQFQ